MEPNELIPKLEELAHLEYDAQRVYAEAMPCVHDDEVAEQFRSFLGDHVRHFDALTGIIKRLGGQEPERRFDAVGRYVDWPTMPHAQKDCEGALSALEAAEHYHSFRYLAARTWDVDDEEVTATLDAFAADEERHQEYVALKLAMAAAHSR